MTGPWTDRGAGRRAPIFVEGFGEASIAGPVTPAQPSGADSSLEPARLQPSDSAGTGAALEGSGIGEDASRAADAVTQPGTSRGRARRVTGLEGSVALATQGLVEVLQLLQVQGMRLHRLEEQLPEGTEDLLEARELRNELERAVRSALSGLRGELPERSRMELTTVVAASTSILAEEAGRDMRLRLAPSTERVEVYVNPPLVERALVHLVRNAREASKPGQEIRMSWGMVELTESERGWDTGLKVARIRIEDLGEGITGDVLPWIFTPFFSLRESPTENPGLGLPMVRAVVEGHGGWVEVSSRHGAGTTVDLYFPPAPVREEPRPKEPGSLSSRPYPRSGRGPDNGGVPDHAH